MKTIRVPLSPFIELKSRKVSSNVFKSLKSGTLVPRFSIEEGVKDIIFSPKIYNLDLIYFQVNEIQDFYNIDLRIGTIIKAEDFPEARKRSYKIVIDFGVLGLYNSSAQITVNYSKEELIGKQIVSIINLGYKRIAGFKSQCLILGVDSQNGIVLISPKKLISRGTLISF